VRIVVLALAILGCQATPAVVRTDLRAYLARSRAWAPVEAEAARTIKRILDTQFVDEAEVRRQIADNRPRVVAHLAELREYQPRSEDVRRVHREYVAAWDRLLAAYDAIDDGFSSGDYTKLARGREGMMAWQQAIVRVADELRQLADHYGIDPGVAIESRGPAPSGHDSTHRT
jgi:hypothetical protein